MAYLEQVFLRLDRQQTQRLLKVAPEAYRTQINDLLLTALGRTLARSLKAGDPIELSDLN